MDKFKSLAAWQHAHQLCLGVLETTDGLGSRGRHPVFDHLRRAAISVQLNIAEGYAYGTTPTFRRQLRIALGSAVEVQQLLTLVVERGYLQSATATELQSVADKTAATLFGLIRSLSCPRNG